MKSKIAALAVALPSMLILSAAPANSEGAAGRHNGGAVVQGDTKQMMINRNIGCFYHAEKPNFLTNGGKAIYASVKITRCTPTPPDKCHLTVSIDNPTFPTVHKDVGWTKCGKKTLTVKQKCASIISKGSYRTVGTLAMVYKGRTNSDVFTSKTVELFCR
ncbi:hypothetical protein [Streptomyces sp. NPDC093589]|uniref:hypothetical protein n=1 Tax=Streptomyces sp. NPDC093589 TaxID=3366043 RepID=UPI00382424AC